MKKRIINLNIIFTILLVTLVATSVFTFFFDLFVNGTETITNLIFIKGADYFMDFFNSIRDAKDLTVYSEQHVIYPALVNCMYFIFGKFMPEELVNSSFINRFQVFSSALSWMTLIVYYIMVFAIVYKIISTSVSNKIVKICLFALIPLSYPLIYAVERGNIVILSAFFLLGYFGLRDNDSKIQREISYILFSLSFCIKLYPFVFIVIPLLEKRYKEVIKMLIYSIVLFVVPFFFYGGVTSIFTMLVNIFRFSSGSGDSFIFSLGIIDFLEKALNCDFMESKTLFILLFVIVIAILFSKNDVHMKVYAILALLFNVGGVNGTYAVLFYLVPLFILVNKNNKNWLDLVMLVLYIIPFMAIPLQVTIGLKSYFFFYASLPVINLIVLGLGVINCVYYLINDAKKIFIEHNKRKEQVCE